jgi:hypothetical protein
MFILFYIVCGVFGLLIGHLIARTPQPKCNHKWKIIKDGDIVNYDRCGQVSVVGFMKVYECEHCKELNTKKAYVNR